MAILIGIAVVFLIMFILGVSRPVIVFVALSLMLIFSVFCVIFFIVSFINLLRSKQVGGRFVGFMYWDRKSDTDDGGDTDDDDSDDDDSDDSDNSDDGDNAYESNAPEYTEDKEKNKVAFAAYRVDSTILRNLFPTDEFMLKLYKKDEDVLIRVCNIGRNRYVIDTVTMVIIFIGLPVFSIITGILVPLIMQYMYIFNV